MLLDGFLSVVTIIQALVVAFRVGSKIYTNTTTNTSSTIDGIELKQSYIEDQYSLQQEPNFWEDDLILPLTPPPPPTRQDLSRTMFPQMDNNNKTSNHQTDINKKKMSLYEWTMLFQQGVKMGLCHLDHWNWNWNNETVREEDGVLYRIVDCHRSNSNCYSSSCYQKTGELEPYRMALIPDSRLVNKIVESPNEDEEVHIKNITTTTTTTTHTDRKNNINNNNNNIHYYYSQALETKYNVTPGHAATIVAYLPDCFNDLRSYFGLDHDQFRESLLNQPFRSFQSNSKGTERTGGMFFWTKDGRFLIKTIKRDEFYTLLRMMPRYTQYMKEQGQQSLLTRFCGLYQISFPSTQPRFFVIMNSVYPSQAIERQLTERFDLKGSTIGRYVSQEEQERLGHRAVLKDLNLVLHPNDDRLRIGPTSKLALMKQLHSDIALLQDCGVIDYSLLVGVSIVSQHTRSVTSTSWRYMINRLTQRILLGKFFHSSSHDFSSLSSIPGERQGQPVLYYFGLIDFLQPFNYKKLFEYRAKSLRYKSVSYSCIPPDLYAKRFLHFMDQYIA